MEDIHHSSHHVRAIAEKDGHFKRNCSIFCVPPWANHVFILPFTSAVESVISQLNKINKITLTSTFF